MQNTQSRSAWFLAAFAAHFATISLAFVKGSWLFAGLCGLWSGHDLGSPRTVLWVLLSVSPLFAIAAWRMESLRTFYLLTVAVIVPLMLYIVVYPEAIFTPSAFAC